MKCVAEILSCGDRSVGKEQLESGENIILIGVHQPGPLLKSSQSLKTVPLAEDQAFKTQARGEHFRFKPKQ